MNVRLLYTFSERQIQDLEERANHDPNNPTAQADYLRVSTKIHLMNCGFFQLKNKH